MDFVDRAFFLSCIYFTTFVFTGIDMLQCLYEISNIFRRPVTSLLFFPRRDKGVFDFLRSSGNFC